MKKGVISYKQLFDTFYLLIITGVFVGLMYSSNLDLKRGDFDDKVNCKNIAGIVSKMLGMDGYVEVELQMNNFNLDNQYVYVNDVKCEYIASKMEKVKFSREGDKIRLVKGEING